MAVQHCWHCQVLSIEYYALRHRAVKQERGVWCCGSTADLVFAQGLIARMDRLFKNKNKRKKSPEPSRPEIPTKVVDRPPGFRAELGIVPKGG